MDLLGSLSVIGTKENLMHECQMERISPESLNHMENAMAPKVRKSKATGKSQTLTHQVGLSEQQIINNNIKYIKKIKRFSTVWAEQSALGMFVKHSVYINGIA